MSSIPECMRAGYSAYQEIEALTRVKDATARELIYKVELAMNEMMRVEECLATEFEFNGLEDAAQLGKADDVRKEAQKLDTDLLNVIFEKAPVEEPDYLED